MTEYNEQVHNYINQLINEIDAETTRRKREIFAAVDEAREAATFEDFKKQVLQKSIYKPVEPFTDPTTGEFSPVSVLVEVMGQYPEEAPMETRRDRAIFSVFFSWLYHLIENGNAPVDFDYINKELKTSDENATKLED